MWPVWLRCVFAWDRFRFALFRFRRRRFLEIEGSVSPNFRFARMRVEPGGRIVIRDGAVTERQRGNHLWVHRNGTLDLGPGTWLRTEHGENRLTVYEGGHIRIGPKGLLNGAMVISKSRVDIEESGWLAFGSRVFDSDLHDLDCETPERHRPVRIGARSWIGVHVVVTAGVTIGHDVIVGANSVVTRDIPPYTLAAGVPARPIRTIASREGCR